MFALRTCDSLFSQKYLLGRSTAHADVHVGQKLRLRLVGCVFTGEESGVTSGMAFCQDCDLK